MVKTQFGIKDLENLSNVKAHTIRIWEKRFNLLSPERTDTNIRVYNLENLKKLLNIAYLYHNGHKISSLASLNPSQIQSLIKESLTEGDNEYILHLFKTAMLKFDGDLFNETLEKLMKDRSFREVFLEVFIPLLDVVGVLWHTDTIDPAHEHFISEKIRHAIIEQSQKIKKISPTQSKNSFALYLPSGEIHDIGLLYVHYELLRKGYSSLYLGANIPMESLIYVADQKPEITFITYFTVQPENDSLDIYLKDFKDTVAAHAACQLWIMGRKAEQKIENMKNIKHFPHVSSFVSYLDNL